MTQTAREVYRSAAKRLAAGIGGPYSCVALNQGLNSPLCRAYVEMFQPEPEVYEGLAWGAAWSDNFGLVPMNEVGLLNDESAQSCRILALCFAAAMAETGDLK